jgi:hypothetical protein
MSEDDPCWACGEEIPPRTTRMLLGDDVALHPECFLVGVLPAVEDVTADQTILFGIALAHGTEAADRVREHYGGDLAAFARARALQAEFGEDEWVEWVRFAIATMLAEAGIMPAIDYA